VRLGWLGPPFRASGRWIGVYQVCPSPPFRTANKGPLNDTAGNKPAIFLPLKFTKSISGFTNAQAVCAFSLVIQPFGVSFE